eukprot:1002962-Rhodomonas_salina.2
MAADDALEGEARGLRGFVVPEGEAEVAVEAGAVVASHPRLLPRDLADVPRHPVAVQVLRVHPHDAPGPPAAVFHLRPHRRRRARALSAQGPRAGAGEGRKGKKREEEGRRGKKRDAEGRRGTEREARAGEARSGKRELDQLGEAGERRLHEHHAHASDRRHVDPDHHLLLVHPDGPEAEPAEQGQAELALVPGAVVGGGLGLVPPARARTLARSAPDQSPQARL